MRICVLACVCIADGELSAIPPLVPAEKHETSRGGNARERRRTRGAEMHRGGPAESSGIVTTCSMQIRFASSIRERGPLGDDRLEDDRTFGMSLCE